jgi:hypothetical protein
VEGELYGRSRLLDGVEERKVGHLNAALYAEEVASGAIAHMAK